MAFEIRQPKTISAFTLLTVITAAMVFVYRALLLVVSPAGHDQAWYLLAAQRFLSGAVLYGPRISETNPPLIIWFSVIPAKLSHLFHNSAALDLHLVVLVMIILGTCWSVRLLRLCAPCRQGIAMFLVACAIAYVELDISSYDFGQREQLVVILILPYILAITSRGISST